MTRREQLVLLFVGCSIVTGSAVLYWTHSAKQDNAPPETETPSTVPSSVITDEIDAEPNTDDKLPLVVSVQGAVQFPEVYRFPLDTRIEEAIEMAGGLDPQADTTSINLAARLIDGTTLYIPKRQDNDTAASLVKNPGSYLLGNITASPVTDIGTAPADARININTATQAELESLPGIGPTYARAIITYRTNKPFRTLEELKDVRGIGEKRFEDMRGLISIQ